MGDCHYLYGNHITLKRITFLQELLRFVGLEDRLHLEWISSAEGQKFAQVVTEFTEKIRAMGTSPVSVLADRFGGILLRPTRVRAEKDWDLDLEPLHGVEEDLIEKEARSA